MEEIQSDQSVQIQDSEKLLKKKNKHRSVWVTKSLLKRDSKGEFVKLYQKLLDDDTQFYEYFRMSKHTFTTLKDKLNDGLKKKDTKWRKSIDPTHRLAVCLRFLITGESLRSISKSYRLGNSTVYFIVKDTCKVIVETLITEVMCPPSVEKWKEIAINFDKIWNFPNCVGAIDSKEIVIQSSTKNRWESTKDSIILLAIVDACCNFIGVEVGTYDRTNDGAVLAHSNLGKALDIGSLNIPDKASLPGITEEVPYVIIGSKSFPSKSYLLRPYPSGFVNEDETRKIFNARIDHARKVVGNTFQMLSQRFGIYSKRLQLKPENADFVILATCVLHNFINKYEDSIISNVKTQQGALRNLPKQGGNAKKEAIHVREMYKTFFSSQHVSTLLQTE